MRTRVAIGLGSNVGRRLARIEAARCDLAALLEDVRCSAVYESEPMYREAQPPFLNACCVGRTSLGARPLLEALQALERRAGRRRGGPRFGPRTLDLDLLLCGDLVIEEPDLRVPHPAMSERPFVLWPLAEIAGDWIHPVTGLTIERMAAALPRGKLRRHAASRERSRQ
ncbi:MAG: 2-amino-4-hydroxy-6-hydroxymethyldihydropteridine diphosphokinase [Gemmatimonadota bacterium]|nr:MAG: 2-amino-4-hydroxy-6-hydroxymethyldihydropteridine diphosphokinase [Gemmatimonadota bacterium]